MDYGTKGHRNKQHTRRKAHQMEVNIHQIERIETQLQIFKGFAVLELTTYDAKGNEVTFSLYSEDLEKLTLHNKPLKIAYDR